MSVASTPPREYKKEKKVGYNLLTHHEKMYLIHEIEFYKERFRKAESEEEKELYHSCIGNMLRELKAHSSSYRSDCITAR